MDSWQVEANQTQVNWSELKKSYSQPLASGKGWEILDISAASPDLDPIIINILFLNDNEPKMRFFSL